MDSKYGLDCIVCLHICKKTYTVDAPWNVYIQILVLYCGDSLKGFSLQLCIFLHHNVLNTQPSRMLLKQNNICCSTIPDSTYKAAPPKAMLFYFVHIPSWDHYAKSLNLLHEIRGPCLVLLFLSQQHWL